MNVSIIRKIWDFLLVKGRASAPTISASGRGAFYCKSGDSKPYFKYYGGAEIDLSETGAKQQVVTVAKAGGDYTTIQEAIDSITDAAIDKVYTVLVFPGEYDDYTPANWINVVTVEPASTKIGSGYEQNFLFEQYAKVINGKSNAAGKYSTASGEGCTAGLVCFDFLGGDYSYSVINSDTFDILGVNVTSYFVAGLPILFYSDDRTFGFYATIVSATYTGGNTRIVKTGGEDLSDLYLLFVYKPNSNLYAYAEGVFTHARRDGSHAEGYYSHAEGEASHAEGIVCYAEGSYSHAEGNYSHAEGSTSHAEGQYSHAYRYAQHSQASGQFSAVGDAQMGRLVMRRSTTNNTPTQLFIDGTGLKFGLESGKCYTFQIMITAKNVTDNYSASWIIEERVDDLGGTAHYEKMRSVFSEPAGSTFASADVAVSAVEGSPDELKIAVTGQADKTIRWVGLLTWVEVL